jgi:GNAT superfamily N-acetyltransferase
MNDWLNQVFPEYAPPRFKTLITRLGSQDGPQGAQICIGRQGKHVVGLVQVLYCAWQDGLIADIDLLGVLAPHRRSGLGIALVQQAIQSALDRAARYQLPGVGIVSLADPAYALVIQFHRKLGGQIRTDIPYASGDAVIWYPLLERYAHVETQTLINALQAFGLMLGEALTGE